MMDMALKAVKIEKEEADLYQKGYKPKTRNLKFKFQARIPSVTCHFYKDSFIDVRSTPTIEVAATGLAMDYESSTSLKSMGGFRPNHDKKNPKFSTDYLLKDL